MTWIKPLKDRVVGRFIEEDTKDHFLILPFEEKQKETMMEVMFVGDEVKDVKVGDTVILPSRWTGAELSVYDNELNVDEKYFIISEMFILAVIEV